MTSVRAAKSKGSAFEMDAEASLMQLFPDCYRTHERGYIQEYDLRSEKSLLAFECKRLKGMSWNQAKTFLLKLRARAPISYKCYLLFKSNQQPCLVMYQTEMMFVVKEFQDVFGIPFIKHVPIKKQLNTLQA